LLLAGGAIARPKGCRARKRGKKKEKKKKEEEGKRGKRSEG